MKNFSNDHYQNLFKEVELKQIDSYEVPSQYQLQKRRVEGEEKHRAKAINYL